MKRLLVFLVLGTAGVLITPAKARAQFGAPPFGVPPGSVPIIVPSTNPFFYIPRYNYQFGTHYSFNTSMGSFSYSSRQVYSGVYNPYATAWALNQYLYTPTYAQGGSYITGGTNTRNDLVLAAQRNLMQAQREASSAAKSSISGQADYEKGGAGAAQGGGAVMPDALRQALTAPEPDQVVSGDSLNVILKEIIRVQAKGAKGPSAFIPPLSMDDIRFAGPQAADLINLARQADNLDFPAAFDDPALAALRADLAKDFATVAVAVQAGKSPEAAKLAKLETTYLRLDDSASAVIKELPFEDAVNARRFLNRMSRAIKAMKAGAATGLIDSKWSVEGLTVADLVKHMTKHKLLFGPAPRGRDEAYATLHRNLATYLFVLTQPKK